jgi:hypothetical protein
VHRTSAWQQRRRGQGRLALLRGDRLSATDCSRECIDSKRRQERFLFAPAAALAPALLMKTWVRFALR